jgi:hypothetical protein
MNEKHWRMPRAVTIAAVALGIAGGSYGIASAANGSSGSSGSSSGATASSGTVSAPSTPNPQQPWGAQRSDETLLTGDTASKVRQLALAKVPGGTIVRVETDADGHAAYEAHMTDASGNPVTVYVDKSLNVVSVESGGPGGRPGPHG